MSKAIEVVIREPRLGWRDLVSRAIAGIVVAFVSAWVVIWLTPFVFGIEIGYWQAFALLFLVRAVWPPNSLLPHLKLSEKQKESK